jgi:chemotaxis protein methyltransferase CheR
VSSVPPSTAGALLHAVLEPTDREFRRFRALVEEEAGIHLNASKKPLLYSRLARRIRELGLGSFDAYYRRVVEDRGGAELTELLDRITTNETHFFREPHHFEHIARELSASWVAAASAGARHRKIRAWSAGCSTGEEPYSLAMTLLACFPPEAGWSIDILATDLSTRVLETARRATWPIAKANEIPRPFLRQFMLQGIGESAGKLRAGPELRDVVRFQRHNLHDGSVPEGEAFDLVFCRNVLIYFELAAKERVIERLLGQLAAGGRLFLGHAESIRNTRGLRGLGATIYAVDERRTA